MRKVLLVVPWLLIAAGIALVYVGGSGAVGTFLSALNPAAQWQTPAVEKIQLPAGNWVVFQQVGTALDLPSPTPGDLDDRGNGLGAAGDLVVVSRPLARATAAGPGLIDPADISVYGPQGRLATACVYCSGSETLTLGTTRYVGIVRFTAPVAGEYTIATEVGDETLIVAPPALQTVGQTFSSLAWLGLGVLLIGAGAIWLLVLLILRLTRSDRKPAQAWQPPSGPPVA